ncbi:hypothetical protein L596_010485 [Steinernema carpocapsae]|uniref:Uncharacterized protein n=1 Tax=Steinernema carpocapsae TaxID=34508 RepID=A0A4V6A729_STECR|nr:hypothetical protein L596_010485 [Steinernema carpocapsae]
MADGRSVSDVNKLIDTESACRRNLYIPGCPNINQLYEAEKLFTEAEIKGAASKTLTILKEIGNFVGDVVFEKAKTAAKLFSMIAGTTAPFLQTQITAVQEGMIEVRDAVMCGIEMTTFNDIARTASDFARSFEASLSAATHTSQCEVTRCFAAACQDLRPGEQLNRLQHILSQPVNYAKKCLESDGFKVNTFNSLLRQTQTSFSSLVWPHNAATTPATLTAHGTRQILNHGYRQFL